MYRFIAGALIIIWAICLAGCGGSSSSSGSTGVVPVYIQTDRVSPQNVTIAVNNQVRWINSSSIPVQVVSGILSETGSSAVQHVVTIGNTGFTPSVLEADFGDTIKFNNLSMSTFNLQIYTTGGQFVASVSLLPGQLSQRIEFDSAGEYTYQKQGNSLFSGTLVLFGEPTPSGQFQSPVLTNGGTFTAQFDFPEFIPYYVMNVNNPSMSFITGSVRIQ